MWPESSVAYRGQTLQAVSRGNAPEGDPAGARPFGPSHLTLSAIISRIANFVGPPWPTGCESLRSG